MATLLLMNPNSNAATTDAMVAIARTVLPGVTGWTAPEGPLMIVTEDALSRAEELVGNAELPEVGGVIVSAFGDPGRAALAARLSCPVVGIGQAAAFEAAEGGRSVAVVTTTPGLKDSIDAMMRGHIGAAYMGCLLTHGEPEALMRDPAVLDDALTEAIVRAAGQGAQSIIIGGGPLGEAADRLAPLSPVPLIAPIRAAARRLKAELARA